MVDLLKIKSLTSSLPLDSDLGNEKKKKMLPNEHVWSFPSMASTLRDSLLPNKVRYVIGTKLRSKPNIYFIADSLGTY